eukprot:gene7704-8509_t
MITTYQRRFCHNGQTFTFAIPAKVEEFISLLKSTFRITDDIVGILAEQKRLVIPISLVVGKPEEVPADCDCELLLAGVNKAPAVPFLEGISTQTRGAGCVGKGNPIYDYWVAVCRPGSVNVTLNKLKFKDEGETCWGWTKDVNELYVRKCYKQALLELEGKRMAIVEGTPGIGKSLFIFYFMYEKVRLAVQNHKKIPTFVIGSPAKKYFLHVDDQGKGVVQSPPPSEIMPDFLITDTIADSEPLFNIQYLHVSSINNENVLDVRKLMDTQKEENILYFPGFSYDEFVESDCDGSRDLVDKNFIYDVFGGNLRNLRSANKENKRYPKDIYDVVQAEMNSFFGGYEVANVPESTWVNTAKALARKLQNPNEGIKMTGEVDPSTISRSVIIHWTPCEEDPNGWHDFPASKFMRHLAGHICDTTKMDALSRLRDAIGPSGAGFVHEHDAHQFRLTYLKKEPGFKIWSLHAQAAKLLCLPINRVVRIRTVDDIKLLREGDYGLPTVSNFPFVDAVINGHLFQDTIAHSHPSVAKTLEILKALNKNKSTRTTTNLIYTLSNGNFDNFKMNNSDMMKPFSQWKTRMELHADDMAGASAPSAGKKRKQDIITEEIPKKSKEECEGKEGKESSVVVKTSRKRTKK